MSSEKGHYAYGLRDGGSEWHSGMERRDCSNCTPALVATTKPAGLDEAWQKAEAALPEGWTLGLDDWRSEPKRLAGTRYEATAAPYDLRDDRGIVERGSTPAAALLALAAALTATEAENHE